MIPDDLLARSLEEFRQGKGSLEAILTRFPYDTRVELEPLLRLALQVERLRDDTETAPSDAFRASLRSQLMRATVEAEPVVYRNGHTPHAPEFEVVPAAPAQITPMPARRTLFPRRWQQLAASFAAGALMVAGAGVGGAQAAKDSLPDQPLLYSLKLAQEKVQLTLASSEDERVGLYLQIAGTRLQELSRATDAGKTDLAYQLSQKYSQTLNQATSSLQNNGPQKNAISNTEVAGFVAQQVTSLQDLQKKAPDGVKEALALALSAAQGVHSDLTVSESSAPGQQVAPPAPQATTTAVVSDPPPPMPSATITVPEPSPAPGPSSGINVTGGTEPGGSIPNREQAPPPSTSGSLSPAPDKSGDQPPSSTAPDKGLSGAEPAPQPIPPRSADTPNTAAPVPAQSGSDAPAPPADPTPAPAETSASPEPEPSEPSGATPPPSDKPPVISVPPDGGAATASPTPPPADDGKGSGGLTPAPTPTPSKGLTTPDSSGDKHRVLPSVRPAYEAEVGFQQPSNGVTISITGALVAPDDGRGMP